MTLVEGVDFYLTAEGLMVFTGDFLRRRGYCCKSGCRHCPYGFQKPPLDSQPRENAKKKSKPALKPDR